MCFTSKVVWAESERVGCAAKACDSVRGLNWGNGKYMLVACNYTPPWVFASLRQLFLGTCCVFVFYWSAFTDTADTEVAEMLDNFRCNINFPEAIGLVKNLMRKVTSALTVRRDIVAITDYVVNLVNVISCSLSEFSLEPGFVHIDQRRKTPLIKFVSYLNRIFVELATTVIYWNR